MNEMQVFNNPEFGKIRAVEIDGEPWFMGKDMAVALEYSNPQKAIRDHVDDEDKTVNDSFTVNGTQAILINESGVYSLIFSSKLESAKKFKRWVTSEVLPAIRKTGVYAAAPSSPPPAQLRALTTDDYITAARLTSDCRNERLPYVLGFLERGGFDIPKVEAITAPQSHATAVVERALTILHLEDFF